jgi:hypothetical protein
VGYRQRRQSYKISPSDGSQISFLPLPESSYGITFVDGGMYVARPGQVRSVDFIETENYVAAATPQLHALLASSNSRCRGAKRCENARAGLQLKYALLPITAHQRIAGLRADPFTRFGRWEDGSHTSEISLPQASTERSRTHQLQFQVTIYNLTHIFNAQLVKLYFKNPELPDGIRVYLDSLPLAAGDEASVEGFRKDWLAKNDGKHPIYAIAAVMKDQQFKTDTRCAIFRSLGIPARRMKFVDLDSRKTSEFVQVYLQPTGWVTITSRYDAAKPREFPVANNELELYSPDDLQVLPRLASSKSGAVAAMPELMKFQKIQIITSSSE